LLSLLVAVAAVLIVVALASSGGPSDSAADASSSSGLAARAASDVIPTSNDHAQVVEPVAGESGDVTSEPVEASTAVKAVGSAKAKAKATPSSKVQADLAPDAPTKDASISDADVLKNGIALPPIEAPTAVHEIIEAGNSIARTPYLWGGGHGKWLDTGYDCSGSISYALASAGLLSEPLDSGRLMSWGEPGKGKWVTIYTNPTHVFMVVAGVRFDTAGTKTSTGSRWQGAMRPEDGFVARHPAGL
jgi:cell wall-associated NlpC family hydrolase